MLPTKIDDPPESLVDEAAISNEISCNKGCATGFVLHIRFTRELPGLSVIKHTAPQTQHPEFLSL